MTAALFCFLGHQTYVGHVANRGPVKLFGSLAALDDGVHGRVSPFRDHALDLF